MCKGVYSSFGKTHYMCKKGGFIITSPLSLTVWGYPPWVFTTHLSQAVVYSVADTTSAYTATAAETTETVTTITKLLSEIGSSAGTALDR